MRYSIQYSEDVHVPAELQPGVFELLLDISDILETIPSSSAFWIGADNGVSELNLGGWQFQYRIEHLERRILVVGARQLGSQARSS